MDTNTISFPGLGIGEFTVNEVALSLFDGKLEIRWYAIFICLGILFGYALFLNKATKHEGISEDSAINLVLLLIPISVIGARTLYVLTDGKHQTFAEAIAIWNGGLAIYGALIFGAITIAIYCRVCKLSVLKLLDSVAPAVLIGQILGRWGNFMNGEAYGWSPNVEAYPWRMVVNGTVAHPTFLYESLWNLVGFVIILLCYRKKRFDGEIISMYVLWYGFGRALIEFLRTDSLYVGNVKLMVVLGFAFFVCGVLGLVILGAKAKKGEAELEEYRRSHPAECAVDTGECSRCNDTGADADSGSDTEPEDNDNPDDASASDDCETKEE